MPRSTTSTLTNTIKSFYDRVLVEALDPILKYYQFGDKRPLPEGEGTSVIWNKAVRLAIGVNVTESPIAAASGGNALSTYKVSAVIQSYAGFTEITDLVDLTSITDVMKLAAERLGAQAGETIERVIMAENFIHHTTQSIGDSAHHYFKTGSAVEEIWGSVSGASAAPGSPTSTVSAAAVITVSDVRAAIFVLKGLNVPAYSGNDYVSIVNTEVAEDIVGDSTWINFHQYAAPGQKNLYTGEIGKIYGCRFVETTQGPAVIASNAGGTASGIAYGTVVMGRGFYGVTELDGGIRTYIAQGAQKSDPINQNTTYGWKSHFTTKLLNTSAGLVLWTGSNTTTTDEDSGTRIDLPSDY